MIPDDLIIRGGTVLNLEGRTLHAAEVLIRGGVITEVGAGPLRSPPGCPVLEAQGQLISPGFMDAHLHIESALLSPQSFARAALIHGTTAVFVDPHELANVLGELGVTLFLEQAKTLPMDLYVGIPSCVPATHMEDAGGSITPENVRRLLKHPRVFGLAEMMNYPGILNGTGSAREKVALTLAAGKVVDGHAPGLTGEALRKYISNGESDGQVRIQSDHECTTVAEALEKRAAGMTLALRHGSASKDMPRLLEGLLEAGGSLEHCMLCSDDLDPAELLAEGHVDRIIRAAREKFLCRGMDLQEATLEAIALATLAPARYFEPFFRREGLPLPGQVAPGFRANLVLLDSWEALRVKTVIHAGRVVFDESRGLAPAPSKFNYAPYLRPLFLGRDYGAEDFLIRHQGPSGPVRVRVIGLTGGIQTEARIQTVAGVHGEPLRHPEVATLAVMERHHGTGSYALGLVERCMVRGAVASTVAHDSHNLIVMGVDEDAMAAAVRCMTERGPGLVVAGETLEHLSLPLGGLMSTAEIEEVVNDYGRLQAALGHIGAPPGLFMKLGFLALPVIPELRLTNRGLVDVRRFDFVSVAC